MILVRGIVKVIFNMPQFLPPQRERYSMHLEHRQNSPKNLKEPSDLQKCSAFVSLVIELMGTETSEFIQG